jgi:hypothetical protein
LVTLKQDTGYFLPVTLPDGTDASPHQRAETEMTDFPREKLNFFKVVADILAILLPFSLLCFIIAIKRLDGKEVDRDDFGTWQNAARVVSYSFFLFKSTFS